MAPRPLVSYEPFRLPYADTKLRVTLGDRTKAVPIPRQTRAFTRQISHDSSEEYKPSAYGSTTRAPLGARVYARSGDKGSNANVGFWVVDDEEYHWLRAFSSIERLKQLLGEDYCERYTLERFEIPGLNCVHFFESQKLRER